MQMQKTYKGHLPIFGKKFYTMNTTFRFRTIFTLIALLFLSAGVSAQTGLSTSKKKTSKTDKKTTEKTESVSDNEEESEKIEYYYSYIVVELSQNDDKYVVSMDKSVFESGQTLPQAQMEMAKKAATGGLKFPSETDFINFMANSNYELVTVTNVADQMGKKSKMFFRIKLEK
jgi:hypothetical protein